MILQLFLKYWKNILIIVLILVLAGSVKKCKNNQDDVKLLSNANNKSYVEASYYKNKHGEVIGQVKTHEITISQLKEHGDKLGFDNKKLKEQVGNLKNLVSHYKGSASVKDTIEIVLRDTVVQSDTIRYYQKYFSWSNNYLTLYGDFAYDTA